MVLESEAIDSMRHPERTRERYIEAIDSVADYLESIGADTIWVDRFDELSGALKDLVKGELPAILRPAIPKIRP